MKFRNPLRSHPKKFAEAIRDNDLPYIKKLCTATDREAIFTAFELLKEETWRMPSEALTALLQEVDARATKGEKTFGMEISWWNEVVLAGATRFCRYDMLDTAMARIGDFNKGEAKDHSIGTLIKSGVDDDKKLKALKKMLSGGHSQIDGADYFMTVAVEQGFLSGLRLMADVGFDVHKNSEEVLRLAAKMERGDICVFLVSERNADIDLAISVERKLDNGSTAAYLEGVRAALPVRPLELSPQERRIRELQETVAEMTAQIEKLKGKDVSLDKVAAPSKKSRLDI